MPGIFNENENLITLLDANSTASSSTAPADTATSPITGDDVIQMSGNYLKLYFFGTDAADETGFASIYGWRRNGTLGEAAHLIDFNFTLGTQTGVAGQAVLDTEYHADTVAIGTVTGPTLGDQAWAGVSSPENNTKGFAFIASLGFPYMEVHVYTGTAASVNAQYTIM